MGMRFVSSVDGDWVHYTSMAIGRLRDLAAEYGGPQIAPGPQRLSAATAARLADALERALPDIPDHGATMHRQIPVEPGSPFAWDLDWDALSRVEFFSGERKAELRGGIALCRRGALTIE